MELYGSPTSPYVRKARVLIVEKGIDCPFIHEDPWANRPELLALNPAGKVPVLRLDNGGTLFESLLVMEYLDAVSGGRRFVPVEGDARWEILRWHALGHALIDAVVVRLLETRRPESLQLRDRLQREEARAERLVAHMEQALPAAPWLVGDAMSFADIAVGVALSYADFRYTPNWRKTAPRLAQWAAAVHARPSLASTLPPGAPPG